MAQNLGSVFPSLGAALGKGAAQPINEHLDLLAQDKLMQLQEAAQGRQMQRQAAMQQAAAQQERARYAQGLSPLLGQEAAGFISNLNPEERKVALQNIGSLMQLTGAPQGNIQGQSSSPGMQALAQGQPSQSTQTGVAQPSGRAQTIENLFTSPAERRQKETLELGKQKFQAQGEQFKTGQNFKEQQAERAARQFEATHGLKREQVAETRGKNVRDFSSPYIEKAEASRSNIRDYDALIKLAKSGKLRSGNAHALLDKFGLDDFNRNFETQAAAKIMARLGQNATSAFGTGRLTNFLESTFQRSLPTLWNTPEGIEKIAQINKLADEANIIKDQTRRQILKETGNRLTPDIEDQILERSRPKIETLENKALKIVGGEVPKIGSRVSSSNTDLNIPVGTRGLNKSKQTVEWNGSAWLPI